MTVKTIDIVNKTPVNKTAALVTGKCKETHLNHKNPCSRESDTPYRIMDRIPFHARNELTNLTGKRNGRLTILGYSRDFKKSWVVRCDCGRYGLRKNRAVAEDRTGKVELMCSGCEKVIAMRRHDEYKRLGFNVERFGGEG